ncbi:Os08g0240600 [Oryza sativa Japonica Group]|uniref:Os08g0240600 protein n=2 Tax=Oryza TaxID=4527 RepID=Q0J717_ORYSJ|nr:Os08g0240600 [Oryza sativa Japonica Group]|eukprot:NP_001061334.2 Os08g0240600 [Oryza sativa Japonica Group]
MDHAADHLDPAAPPSGPASSSAAVAEVNAWLASLAAEAGGAGGGGVGAPGGRGGVVGVGGGGAAPELSLGPEPTPRGVAYLRALAAASQARSRAAGIAAAGLRAQAAEYRAEAARLREALERAGLARDALSPPAAVSARAVAAVANLLAIRDTEMSSFVVASADLSLRRAEVEEKRDKVHKESKALLDYTRKAITKLTELKKMLEKFKNDVEKQQAEQMTDWQTKLVMMDSKERQYILQVSNYKAMLNRVGYTPEINHGVLMEMAEHKKDLERKTKPIADTLRSYQDLPPLLSYHVIDNQDASEHLGLFAVYHFALMSM